MNISVLGCGRWGSFIGWYLCNHGNAVMQWGREESPSFQVLKNTGRNEYVRLDEKITLTSDLEKAVEFAEVIVISISAQSLRSFMRRVNEFPVDDKIFVLCMKGIEVETGKRLSEVMAESGISPDKTAVWVGPGHIQAFTQGQPNCMVIDSVNKKLVKRLADAFKSDAFLRIFKQQKVRRRFRERRQIRQTRRRRGYRKGYENAGRKVRRGFADN